jgi:DNA-binding IclR family transcriptional regulator
LQRRPEQLDAQLGSVLDSIRAAGYESIPSVQVRGLYAVSFPVLDAQGRAIAALTVPYAERIDQVQRKSIPEVTTALGLAARVLSQRLGGRVSARSVGLNEQA